MHGFVEPLKLSLLVIKIGFAAVNLRVVWSWVGLRFQFSLQ